MNSFFSVLSLHGFWGLYSNCKACTTESSHWFFCFVFKQFTILALVYWSCKFNFLDLYSWLIRQPMGLWCILPLSTFWRKNLTTLNFYFLNVYVYMHVTCNLWRLEVDVGSSFPLLSILCTEAGLLFELLTCRFSWHRWSAPPSLPSKWCDYIHMPLPLVFMSVLGLKLSFHIVEQVPYPLGHLASPQMFFVLKTEPLVIRKHNSIIRYGQRKLTKSITVSVYIICFCAYSTHTHTINDGYIYSKYRGRIWFLYFRKHHVSWSFSGPIL